ncbi:cytochrome P450 [Actinoplanes sp. NPDC049265]|uniref:cytochrome P450 n=1 Tax=Actinoplanes sp. NPDC049265 TaxID=3363902 RepID=UPI00371A1D7F
MTTAEEVPNYPFKQEEALRPPAELERLRGDCPISRVRLASGDEALLVTRYDDVRALLADPRFTRRLTAPDAARLSASETPSLFNRGGAMAQLMQGGGHLRWRRMMGRTFTAKRVNAMRPRVEELAHSLVGDMLAGGQPADLNAALGFPLPVFVICELLGVPADARDRFAHWSDAMLNLNRYTEDELITAGFEFHEFMAAHVQLKRAHPGDDLLSELTTVADAEDGRLSEEELIGTGIGLLVAGHETTANMIGKMMAMLLAERRHWERLVADRTLIPTAVEESLRVDPNQGIGLPRYISEDIEVAGRKIPAGSTVLNSMAAANRDAEAFTDPDEMVLDRRPNPHLTFGVGLHACLGQALARVELQSALTVLTERVPTLALAVPPESLRRKEGLIVGGLRELPVQW